MLNVSLLISIAHSSMQPEFHKQTPWPPVSNLPSFLEKPCPVAMQHSGLATWHVLPALTQSASSQVFCWGGWSVPRTAEVGKWGRLYLQWLTRALGTVPASELHFLIKFSAQMCSIMLVCPFRSSVHPYRFRYVPQEAVCQGLRQVLP